MLNVYIFVLSLSLIIYYIAFLISGTYANKDLESDPSFLPPHSLSLSCPLTLSLACSLFSFIYLCVNLQKCSVTSLPLFSLAGGWGRLWVLCEAAAGDFVLGAKLLRRVWQRRGDDERRRDPDVLLPGQRHTISTFILNTGLYYSFSVWIWGRKSADFVV